MKKAISILLVAALAIIVLSGCGNSGAVYGRRCHFLAVHLQRAIARDEYDFFFGKRQSRADCGGQPEAHRAEPP